MSSTKTRHVIDLKTENKNKPKLRELMGMAKQPCILPAFKRETSFYVKPKTVEINTIK